MKIHLLLLLATVSALHLHAEQPTNPPPGYTPPTPQEQRLLSEMIASSNQQGAGFVKGPHNPTVHGREAGGPAPIPANPPSQYGGPPQQYTPTPEQQRIAAALAAGGTTSGFVKGPHNPTVHGREAGGAVPAPSQYSGPPQQYTPTPQQQQFITEANKAAPFQWEMHTPTPGYVPTPEQQRFITESNNAAPQWGLHTQPQQQKQKGTGAPASGTTTTASGSHHTSSSGQQHPSQHTFSKHPHTAPTRNTKQTK